MRRHNWSELRRRVEDEGSRAARPAIELPIRDGSIKALLWPREQAKRGDTTYPTAMTHPARSGWGPKEAIRSKLVEKAGAYGDLGAPLVIALYDTSPFGDDYEIESSLYGSEVVVVTLADGVPVRNRSDRAPEGGLYRPSGARELARVSGVLSASWFSYAAVARMLPTYWPNPWCESQVRERLPWHRRVADLNENELRTVPSDVSPHSFFGLEEGWPGRFFTQKRRWRHGRQAA